MDLFAVTSQEILERVSKHCPDALGTYLQCLNRCDQEGSCFFSKSLVTIDMSESWAKFRNHVKALAREHLLEWHPLDNGISVTLAVIDEE